MRIAREEIFGPVACVIRAKDYDEALALANDTEFGLCSGIVTTSLKHASHFKRHAQAGMVMVNLPTAGVDYHVPFGGRKGSSYGAARAGTLRGGVLHDGEDGVHRAVIEPAGSRHWLRSTRPMNVLGMTGPALHATRRPCSSTASSSQPPKRSASFASSTRMRRQPVNAIKFGLAQRHFGQTNRCRCLPLRPHRARRARRACTTPGATGTSTRAAGDLSTATVKWRSKTESVLGLLDDLGMVAPCSLGAGRAPAGAVRNDQADQQIRGRRHRRDVGRRHADLRRQAVCILGRGSQRRRPRCFRRHDSGEVFNLKNVADLSGTYAAAEIGAAVVKGENDTIMKNEKGVVLRLHGTQKGARLTLGPGGVKIKLKS